MVSITPASTTLLAGAPINASVRSDKAAARGPIALEEGEGNADNRSFVKSVARGMTVIHAFANASRPLSIAEVSHRVDVPRAAVRRMLHTLCELGYVRALGSLFQTRYEPGEA
jgi:IclR helix-turn-helix domain